MRARSSLLLAGLAALLGVAAGCEEFCENLDCGSCGNACCRLTYALEHLSTTEVVALLNKTLADGGPDGLYKLQMTAEGTLGFADLRHFGKPVDYIGQAHHLTAKLTYTDTINFTIAPQGSGSLVTAFSISQVAGAYCDDGQNYSNIQMIFAALGLDDLATRVDGSCGGHTA